MWSRPIMPKSLKTPGQFYFASGSLSSVLDNAPTYLTFLEAQLGKLDNSKVDVAAAEIKRMGETRKLEVDDSLDQEVQAAAIGQFDVELLVPQLGAVPGCPWQRQLLRCQFVL